MDRSVFHETVEGGENRAKILQVGYYHQCSVSNRHTMKKKKEKSLLCLLLTLAYLTPVQQMLNDS